MRSYSVFLKLAGVEAWERVCNLKVEDQKEGVTEGQKRVTEYLLANKHAVPEEAQLRGANTGDVFVTWTPSHIQTH